MDNDPDLKLTGTKLARVIQRPRDFNETFDTIEFQKKGWKVDNKNFLQAFSSMYQVGVAFGAACKREFVWFIDCIYKNWLCLDALKDDKMMERLRGEKFDIAIGQFGDQVILA